MWGIRTGLSEESSATWVARLPRVGLGSVLGRESILQSPSHVRPGDLIISGAERYRVASVDPPMHDVIQVHLAYSERRSSLYLQAATPVRVVRTRRRKPKAPSPSR
ncbi:hypothetical protein ACFQFC_10085 [Amorphoplanes digitatis]|uniref:Uncharacterized protein n=1 Tax=Actinoplanes digitatis TaxID=1868 RepID=A0A7W7I120_9ACTN|nr:hypothetical protein [Actinoplanes digitatis]MBB4764546.1 hypothetical protein [Actinoplanes digitatis]BFE74028.1 hypothetical protein GCM10020092_073290 [Actinoplanes digitatis]GID91502.1 hypothetical protein Adi01nite_09140 [Actinoplanes digitatis]